MEVKALLLREDGETNIWCKFYDATGNLSETEFTISYDEWDAIKKTRLEKNVWKLEIPKTEQDERIEWILEPQRMMLVLRALAKREEDLVDINFLLGLGTVSEEYQIKFGKSPIDFIIDARKAKEVFEFMLTK